MPVFVFNVSVLQHCCSCSYGAYALHDRAWWVLPSHVMYICAFIMVAVLSIWQIHVDSCFYQSPENGRLLPLEAHEWHSLKFGDSFSLMVDKYIFKVLSAQPVESTERYQYLPIMILFSLTAFLFFVVDH